MASAQLRGRRAGIPSFKTPMICSSVNLLPSMPSSCRFLGGLSLSVDLFSEGTSSKESWSNVAVARMHFTLVPWNGMRDNRSGVYLQLTRPDAKAHFGLIEQNHHNEVETALSPLGELVWRQLPNAKESHIYILRTPTNPSDPNTWAELNEWMARALETAHGLFRPIIKAVRAEDYVHPGDGSDEGNALQVGGDA